MQHQLWPWTLDTFQLKKKQNITNSSFSNVQGIVGNSTKSMHNLKNKKIHTKKIYHAGT